ncbi:MAG: SPL family radical SAM protein [Candidatus Micrarchaeia archaeon]
MEIKEIFVKSVMSRSKILDYCINPYIGCEHSCTYCYASYYTKIFRNKKEKWGSYVEVKINAPFLLSKEIKNKKGSVYLSSLTDPYQPIESKYMLTRKILEILKKENLEVVIQTKSPLVLRDIDLLKNMNATVGFTIISTNEKVRKAFEPKAPSIESRIEALKKLKENGIKTFAFFGPLLPELSDVEELVKKLSFVDEMFFDKLNLKPGIWESIEETLKLHFPQLIEKWEKIFFGKDDYYEKLKMKIESIAKDKNKIINF